LGRTSVTVPIICIASPATDQTVSFR